jgi:hypothetical protein
MSIFWQSTPKARLARRWSMFVHAFYLDRAPADATIFICGSPRSGTTWLAEVLNHDNRWRFVGEPFTAGQVPMCNSFALRQYLRPGDTDPRYLGPARKIFAGKIRNGWADNPNRCSFPKGRFVKDVRTTLLLKWFRTQFPWLPIVYIIRHPFAVAASRVRLGYRTDMGTMYPKQPALMEDHLAPFAELLAEPKSPFACHVLDWCVENYVPLRQLEAGDVTLVFYETLTADHAALLRLFTDLKLPEPDLQERRLSRPSLSTMERDRTGASFARGTGMASWRTRASAEDLAAGARILECFGLQTLYDGHGAPDMTAVARLLERPRG